MSAGTGLVAAVAPGALVTGGCASVPVKRGGPSIDAVLGSRPRVMWIAPHPDDEALVGSILAKSSLVYKNPTYFLVLTRGEGGECCLEEGCSPDVATIRHREMRRAARLYRAELQHERFFNASLPVESFPKRHELAQIWMKYKDPTVVCAEAIRRFRPDIIFTFHPEFGFTGHPEHQLASRFAMAGERLAANPDEELGGLPPHKVSFTYFGLNRYGLMHLFGYGDPDPPSEIWNARQPCVNGLSCREVMAEFSKAHQTQDNDMGMVRRLVRFLNYAYLLRVDPYTEIWDPFEYSSATM